MQAANGLVILEARYGAAETDLKGAVADDVAGDLGNTRSISKVVYGSKVCGNFQFHWFFEFCNQRVFIH